MGIILIVIRGVAQLGRALPWGGRGRGFESRRSDHEISRYIGYYRCSGFFIMFNLENALVIAIMTNLRYNNKLSVSKKGKNQLFLEVYDDSYFRYYLQ